MFHLDDRHHNFLKHRAAMNKARAAGEMEAVITLGNPELHTAPSLGGHGRIAPPGLLVRRQIVAQEVSLLRDDRAGWFVLQPAPVRIARRRFGEQKTVVRCDHHIIAVEIIDDIADKLGYFPNRLS